MSGQEDGAWCQQIRFTANIDPCWECRLKGWPSRRSVIITNRIHYDNLKLEALQS